MVQYRGQSWFSRNKFMFIPFIVVASILVSMISILLIVWCTSAESVVKTFESSVSWLEQTVILYGYDGEEIDRWEDTMCIENDDPGETSFTLDGKRTIIEGGIVVIEER